MELRYRVHNNKDLKDAIDFIANNLSQGDIVANILRGSDYYMALADYADYTSAKKRAAELYENREVWNKMALTNIAKAGIFAADRSIDDYIKNIWKAKSIL